MLLQIKQLESWYGSLQILHSVNLHINDGEIVSIIGPNGAGKSTVLKNIFGLVPKNNGSILFHGKEIRKMKPHDIIHLGISYVPQGRSVFPSLTVLENLEMGAYIVEKNIHEKLTYVFQLFPVLKQRQNQPAGLLSGGEQQMVAIARALMVQPQLMLLDEPSLGLSPKIKELIFKTLVEINLKHKVTMLIVEQNAKISLACSHRAYVLELGKNKLEGSGKELLHDKRVQKLYLGGMWM